MECIFCKIVKGEIPSKKIYEDDLVIAFLDINQSNPGHTLIIPKEHTLDLQTIDIETLTKIMNTAKYLSKLILEKMDASGYTIVQNNGIAQDVKHFHLHIIPKYEQPKELSIDEIFKKITSGE